jgi:hypothetical protein
MPNLFEHFRGAAYLNNSRVIKNSDTPEKNNDAREKIDTDVAVKKN